MISRKNIIAFLLCLLCFQTANAEWTRQNTGTFAWLRAIFFVDEKNGWIGGSEGSLLITNDGGVTWEKARKFTGDTIREIYFADQNQGWLLCERDVYSLGPSSPSYLLKTTDGGLSWEKIEFTGGRRERITDIFFTRYNAGFAVGETGALFSLQSDGKTWKKQPAPSRYLLLNGTFFDDMNGVIIGANGTILFTEDAGLSWDRSSVAGNTEARLNSVFFLNKKMGWAVGTQGKVFQTINGGKYWREQNSNVTKDLNDIFFINTAEGWAVGSDGVILHTLTAGNVWQTDNSKVSHKLEKIVFAGKKGFAVGFGGTVLTYESGAKENKSKFLPPQLQKRN